MAKVAREADLTRQHIYHWRWEGRPSEDEEGQHVLNLIDLVHQKHYIGYALLSPCIVEHLSDLFPRLLPVERETLSSFLSRLAASKGVKSPDLALDMGFSFKRLLNQDHEALERLQSWSRLSDDELSRLRSWTGAHAGKVTTLFRGEVFGSRALRSPVVRGCPICLQEDAAVHPGDPLVVMAMRGHWQLHEVTICLRHGHPLVPLWEEHDPVKRLDIQLQLDRISDRLLDGSFRQPELAASTYVRTAVGNWSTEAAA